MLAMLDEKMMFEEEQHERHAYLAGKESELCANALLDRAAYCR